jgi:hypothetical protein
MMRATKSCVAIFVGLLVVASSAGAQPDQAALPALLTELHRVETIAPTEEGSECLFTLLDAICRYDDPRIVRPLLPFLGTGRRVIDTVAKFGAYSVQPIADFVDSGQSDATGVSSALFTLRVIQRETLLDDAGRATVGRIAGQRLEGQQTAAVIEQALELAIATGDTPLAERVKALARDSSQMRALVMPGSSDGSIVDHLQRKARSLLARE